MNKHKCRRVDGGYLYRGVDVSRGASPQGYWGAWQTFTGVAGKGKIFGDSLKDVKIQIDQRLDSNKKIATEINRCYSI